MATTMSRNEMETDQSVSAEEGKNISWLARKIGKMRISKKLIVAKRNKSTRITEFPMFLQLPPELRIKIIRMAIEEVGPRLVALHEAQGDFLGVPALACVSYRNPFYIQCVQQPIPILFASREIQQICMEVWQSAFWMVSESQERVHDPGSLFDFEKDTLMIEQWILDQQNIQIHSFKHVKRLIILYDTIIPPPNVVRLLSQLPEGTNVQLIHHGIVRHNDKFRNDNSRKWENFSEGAPMWPIDDRMRRLYKRDIDRHVSIRGGRVPTISVIGFGSNGWFSKYGGSFYRDRKATGFMAKIRQFYHYEYVVRQFRNAYLVEQRRLRVLNASVLNTSVNHEHDDAS